MNPDLRVSEGHQIVCDARKEILKHLKYLSGTTVHVDSADESGEVSTAFQTGIRFLENAV